MIIHCAWCGHVICNKPPFGGKYDNEITQGICNPCYNKELRDLEEFNAKDMKEEKAHGREK